MSQLCRKPCARSHKATSQDQTDILQTYRTNEKMHSRNVTDNKKYSKTNNRHMKVSNTADVQVGGHARKIITGCRKTTKSFSENLSKPCRKQTQETKYQKTKKCFRSSCQHLVAMMTLILSDIQRNRTTKEETFFILIGIQLCICSKKWSCHQNPLNSQQPQIALQIVQDVHIAESTLKETYRKLYRIRLTLSIIVCDSSQKRPSSHAEDPGPSIVFRKITERGHTKCPQR